MAQQSIFKEFQTYEDFEPAGVELPKIELEGRLKGKSSFEALRLLCQEGFKERGLSKVENKKEYVDRVKYELDILEELGFTDYILLNWDIIHFCHENDIPVGGGRGSAAGSLVLYLIKVTNIDPIKHGLFFERFVSKTRARKIKDKSGQIYLDGSLLADIDNDISYEHRSQVVEYIEEKFKGKTAKILTFNTLTSKACISEAAKYFNKAKKSDVDYVSGLIPKLHGKVAKLEKAREDVEDFDQWCKDYPEAYEQALKIEGLVKNTSVHASGIAISAQQIDDIIPLQLAKDSKTGEQHLITGYDMNDVGALTVKFDILGLRTLSFVERCCKRVGINRLSIDPEDNFIYQKLQDFNSPFGLFQISAHTNADVTRKVKPMNLRELSDVVALARPGAMAYVDDYVAQKLSPEPYMDNKEMGEILSWSKNLLLYQEQVMSIANKAFGFPLEDAETLRRIIGKKKVEEIPKWKEKIFDQAREKKIPDSVTQYFWDTVEASANYQFNLSHSLSYATLSAITVYLKYKYPAEFFVSILEIVDCFQEPLKMVEEINAELSKFGIELLPPNLQKSELNFTIEDGNIRYGLNAIKGVSEKTFESLVKFRNSNPQDKYGIFLAAKQSGLNIGVLSSLIFCGALEKWGRNKLALEAQSFNLLTDREKRNFIKFADGDLGRDLLQAIHTAVTTQKKGDDNKPIMKKSRFETFKKKFDKYKKLYLHNSRWEKFCYWWFEKHLLGYSYTYTLRDCCVDLFEVLSSIQEIKDFAPREKFQVVGVVFSDVYINTSQNGNKYARINLSDETGDMNFLFCDSKYDNTLSKFLDNDSLNKDDILVMSGSISKDGTPFVNDVSKISTEIFTNIRQVK